MGRKYVLSLIWKRGPRAWVKAGLKVRQLDQSNSSVSLCVFVWNMVLERRGTVQPQVKDGALENGNGETRAGRLDCRALCFENAFNNQVFHLHDPLKDIFYFIQILCLCVQEGRKKAGKRAPPVYGLRGGSSLK